MKKWILFSLPLALLIVPMLSVVHAAPTAHSASFTFTDIGTGITGYNCYKSATTGGPYSVFAPGITASPCVDTSPGAPGTKTFYVVTALAGTSESAYSNEVSGVAVGTVPPTAGVVSEQ